MPDRKQSRKPGNQSQAYLLHEPCQMYFISFLPLLLPQTQKLTCTCLPVTCSWSSSRNRQFHHLRKNQTQLTGTGRQQTVPRTHHAQNDHKRKMPYLRPLNEGFPELKHSELSFDSFLHLKTASTTGPEIFFFNITKAWSKLLSEFNTGFVGHGENIAVIYCIFLT